jgi:hypothetical protein
VTGALDSTFRPLAVNLINKFGTVATLRRRVSVHNVSTGKVTTTDTDTPVIISPPSPFNVRRFGSGLIAANAALYQQGDMECLIAAQGLAVEPTPLTDHIVHSGKEWHLIAVAKLYSGNFIAAYRLQLRE